MNDFGEPLLSGEEAEALLEAMRAGAGEGAARDADLASGDRSLRHALGRADRVADELARGVRRIFLRVARCAATAVVDPPQIVPFDVLFKSIMPGSVVAELRTRDQSLAVAVIGPSIARFVLERRLGAPLPSGDEGLINIPSRVELSALDRCVIAPLVNEIVATFSTVWCDKPDAIPTARVLPRSVDFPPTAAQEPMLRIVTRVSTSAGLADDVVIALSTGSAGVITPRDSVRVVSVLPQDRARMKGTVATAEVELVAILGRARMSIRQLLGLGQGDLIRLDQVPDHPVDVKIGTSVKFRGSPVVHFGNLAVEVTETS